MAKTIHDPIPQPFQAKIEEAIANVTKDPADREKMYQGAVIGYNISNIDSADLRESNRQLINNINELMQAKQELKTNDNEGSTSGEVGEQIPGNEKEEAETKDGNGEDRTDKDHV